MAENKYVIDKRKSRDKQYLAGFSAVLEKIKRVKHLDVVIGVGVVALVLVLFLGVFSGDESSSSGQYVESKSEYLQIEDRLSDVLSKINGAGKVSVMINFAGTSEIITEKTTNLSEDKTVDSDSSGSRETESKTESLSPVIIQKNGEDSPLIVKEILPDIVGVIVVAEGANNMSVRINLLQAVQTLLSVSADKVEIFTMK